MCLAIPGQIVELHEPGTDLATVDVSGVKRRVNVGLLDAHEAAVGTWVLIHVGFAMSAIGEDETALEEFNGILDRGSGGP